MFPENEVLG